MASLNDICYEHIKDSFYYGIFGNFKLVIDQNTGCFNATKLCNDGGKNFYKWTRLEKSKKIIEYYNHKSRPNVEVGSTFYEIKGDNKNELISKTTGQYVKKELILDIASWISIEFYDKCNEVIVDFFVSEFKVKQTELQKQIQAAEDNIKKLQVENEEKEYTIKIKDDKIDELFMVSKRMENMLLSMGIEVKDIKEQNNELLNEVGELREDNNELQEQVEDVKEKIEKVQIKLDISVEDRAPQPDKRGRKERFILRNDEQYPYYTIRAQDMNAKKAVRRQQTKYSEVTLLLDLICHPNTKTFYVRIKDDLKKKGVRFNLCEIDISGSEITEEELIVEMKRIDDEKRDV